MQAFSNLFLNYFTAVSQSTNLQHFSKIKKPRFLGGARGNSWGYCGRGGIVTGGTGRHA